MPQRKSSNKFVDQRLIDQMVSQGRDYIENHKGDIVTLYGVDIIKTKIDETYGEEYAEDKIYKDPIDLNALVQLGDVSLSYMKGTTLTKNDFENVQVFIYEKELEEKQVSINMGDYLVYFDGKIDRFFEVLDGNVVNTATNNLFGGVGTYAKHFKCKQVKENIFLPFRN